MMKSTLVMALAGCACINSSSVAQQITFRTWFEAPDEVLAGETFQVKLWASIERDGILVPTGPGQGYFLSMSGSVGGSEAGSNNMAFSSLLPFPDGLLIVAGNPGVPDGSWLRDFLAFQFPANPFIPPIYLNPHPLVMFEVTTASGARGDIMLNLQESLFDLAITWRDSVNSQSIASNEEGVLFLPETGVIRVIPTPASLALLVPLAIASSRRRRG